MTGAFQMLRYRRAWLRRRKASGRAVVWVLSTKRNAPFGASGQRCYRWRGAGIFPRRGKDVKTIWTARDLERNGVIRWAAGVDKGVLP